MPVFFINLDSRADRRAFITDQLSALGLNATRISATRAEDLPAWLLDRHTDMRRPLLLSPEQLACTMSHTRAWRAVLETGAERALILEDDALLSKRLPEFLGHVSDLAFDAIRIEVSMRRQLTSAFIGDIEVAGVRLRRFRSTGYGAAGYLISASATRKLLASPDLWRSPADYILFCPRKPPASELNLAQADPALCIQIGQFTGHRTGLGASDNAMHISPGTTAARAARMRQKLRRTGIQAWELFAFRHYKRRIIRFAPD